MATCCICENEHAIGDNDNSIHNKEREKGDDKDRWIGRLCSKLCRVFDKEFWQKT